MVLNMQWVVVLVEAPGSPGMPQKGDRAAAGVRVVNVIDPRLFEDFINTNEGEQAILNVIEKNPRRVKSSLGG
jgi:hypothetical protein